ncbi:hypothetical protein F4811DRAFT_512329 [Daldinia bambusicola]|nr:hypothetical protein F4811DRAFT_512329 [Daldinia bambusicola]
MYSSFGAKDHPVFSSLPIPLKERFQLHRKYGKYYTRSFKPVVGASHFLGQGKIGDVEVACKFLFRESKWGVLTEDEDPGGIVYLDLTFTEPLDCRLKSAVVSVTLDEDHKDLPRRYSKDDSVPVHIIKHGPPDLSGEPDSASILKKFNATPQLDAAGMAGIGGVGYEKEKQYLQYSQWRFSGSESPNAWRNGATIEWRLRESELGRQPAHDNTFHTGFAFQHGGQPFYIRVEVGGCLEGIGSNMRHKVTHKFRKFKFPTTPQSATTLVYFGGRHNKFRNPLDGLAQNLPNEMLLKNIKPVVRVPGKLPGNRLPSEVFEQDVPNYPLEDNQYNHARDSPVHMRDAPESVSIKELRKVMQGLLSLRQPPIEEINPGSVSTSPRSNSQTPDRVETSIGSSTDSGRQQNEITRSVTMVENTNHEEVRKHVKDASLPVILELMILWILTVGSWMSPSKKLVQESRRVT